MKQEVLLTIAPLFNGKEAKYQMYTSGYFDKKDKIFQITLDSQKAACYNLFRDSERKA